MQTEQQSLRAAAGQRFWQIDALRGLALLNMLVYHAMYDWVYIFGHASGWYDIWSTHCHVWQQYICWSFILLSGYSFTLSRRPLKNGLLTAACAVVLTVATAVAMPEEVIWFGVLHPLGWGGLLTRSRQGHRGPPPSRGRTPNQMNSPGMATAGGPGGTPPPAAAGRAPSRGGGGRGKG